MWPFSKSQGTLDYQNNAKGKRVVNPQQQAAFDQKLSECAEKWKIDRDVLEEIVFKHSPGKEPLDREVFKHRKAFLDDHQRLECSQDELLDLIEAYPAQKKAATYRSCGLLLAAFFVLLLVFDHYFAFGTAFIFAFAIFILLSIAHYLWNMWRLMRIGKTANGSVIKYHEELHHDNDRTWTAFSPVVEFVTADGKKITIKSDTGSSKKRYQIGETLKVRYDPQDPHNAVAKEKVSLGCVLAVLIFALPLLLILIQLDFAQ